MHFIAHRINTVSQLKEIPLSDGIEVDLRDGDSEVVMVHAPFKAGENFEELLKVYKHGTLILNIKSERIAKLASMRC